jgi:hypothetical protein
MEPKRLFVVIRAIGDDLSQLLQAEQAYSRKRPWTVMVFENLEEATECFEDNAYTVRNAPEEGPNNDPTIVTGCALYAVNTSDHDTAAALAQRGHGVLLESEEWPIDP